MASAGYVTVVAEKCEPPKTTIEKIELDAKRHKEDAAKDDAVAQYLKDNPLFEDAVMLVLRHHRTDY